MSYCGARRVLEKRIFSPTQSFTRLTSSSNGRTALPPSHPHAAASDAVPAPAASCKNARRSIMARESPPIPAGNHGPERSRIDDEHENHVHDEKRGEDPHRPEVRVARCLEASEQRGEPRELRGLVDRESSEHREHAEQDDECVGELLERIVLPLRRMILAQPQVVLLHLDGAPDVARPEQQRPPFTAEGEIGQIHKATSDERPHQREVPVQSSREPPAEPAPRWKGVVLESIHVVRTAALAEPRVRTVDLQSAHDHSGKQHKRHPVGEAHDPVVAFDGLGGSRSDWDRRSCHALSILCAMRAATLVAIALLSACRSQNAAVTVRTADTLTSADVTPRDSADTALLTPRVISEPTVVVFWLSGADTLSADDQAQALDELNATTEDLAPTLAQHHITLVPTNSDTIYVALPNKQRRMILLTGVDYPFGYVLVAPGTAERILAGVYDDDELLDEVDAYFDLPSGADSTAKGPRIAT